MKRLSLHEWIRRGGNIPSTPSPRRRGKRFRIIRWVIDDYGYLIKVDAIDMTTMAKRTFKSAQLAKLPKSYSFYEVENGENIKIKFVFARI